MLMHFDTSDFSRPVEEGGMTQRTGIPVEIQREATCMIKAAGRVDTHCGN